MTFPELCIGMVISAMVLGATGALWYAVCETWRTTGASQAVASTANQATLRLEATFRQTRYLINYEPGSLDKGSGATPARAFIWCGDFWNRAAQKASGDYKTPLADGAIQVAELGLVDYDPATARLYFYRAKDASVLTDAQRDAASEVPTLDRLQKPETRETFKTLDFVERTVLADGVSAFKLGVPALDRASRPTVDFTMDVARKGSSERLSGSATLRSPSTQPAY
jgi:hypothetical protein